MACQAGVACMRSSISTWRSFRASESAGGPKNPRQLANVTPYPNSSSDGTSGMEASRVEAVTGVGRVDFFGAPRPSTLVDPNLKRVLDEPKEIPLPGEAEVARITGSLPVVRRGPIVVRPGARPAVRKAIRVPDDVKGMKIRCAGRGITSCYKAAGASPLYVTPPDIYLNIQ